MPLDLRNERSHNALHDVVRIGCLTERGLIMCLMTWRAIGPADIARRVTGYHVLKKRRLTKHFMTWRSLFISPYRR